MNDNGSSSLGAAPEPTRILPADGDGLARAAALLRQGRLVAFPTETVYGLGGDATDPQVVAAIYAAKERPRFNPLIAHLPDAAAARLEGDLDARAARLAEAFWPGPLTLVVPVARVSSVCELARAGLDSIALRVPGSALARDLLAEVGRPVAAPSANRSGRISPTRAEHVRADLDGRIAAILDGGPSAVGLESSVVACLGGPPRLLRPGGIPREALREVLGEDLTDPSQEDAERPAGPGLLASHYAPRATVRLDAASIRPGEAALLFGGGRPEGLMDALAWIDLSERGDLAEAAANLFSALRFLDASGARAIAVVPIPRRGLGEAIADRLARAAAPR